MRGTWHNYLMFIAGIGFVLAAGAVLLRWWERLWGVYLAMLMFFAAAIFLIGGFLAP